ncbi:RecQ family ATP-dependent DNA helicase [Chitinophaga sp. G-6-1-13]|uniref:DNA 3'-5' helicase n=1 Tax=Chitinophaga fulva TaxID=2728842 RepID=A0A848GKG6_9BACT|nr:RecQ family ATP-dependent DNA helicase [Chitinophaga fulva]NML38914.1 RecQ family ATP-dependent DNA helicase [Chitinophaga fulva]
MTRQEAELILLRIFGIAKFHDEQWTAIERVLKGERVLLIEKTGFGKSLCFQFPATVFKGITIIFSPLIALMRDQVKKLNAKGVSARCINSEQTPEENSQIISEAKTGQVKILYIAPERQENSEWVEATSQMNISMVVVDEAHCISVWGHDFRPAFRRIINLIKLLPKGLPVLATTATATQKVERDIAQQIGGSISTIRGNLMRDNFKLFVVKVASEEEKFIWLGQYLNKLPGSGILYTGTRFDTEIYSKWFEYLNISSTAYNAGLDTDSRIAIENGLMTNQWKCIISTNALGMGIDKPDIRFIIHSQIPQSPIHYYQEIGRAGRDGNSANIILFYNPEDRKLPEAFIEGGRPSLKKYEKVILAVKSDLLGEWDLMRVTNMKQNQIRVIKADLIEQGIIREVMIGKSKKYEFIPGSPSLNTKVFDELRNSKLNDLESMIQYVGTEESRMKFLCDYLGDNSDRQFNNCDNTGEQKIGVSVTPEWSEKLQSFRENYFPELEVESKNSNMSNGVAASYYGVSNVGAALHRSKYEGGGDYADFLLKLVLKAFRKKFGQEKFDLIVYVPPTSSGDLVKNFATKISQVLKFPISHNLQKIRKTDQQKIFENSLLKSDNVNGAFTFTAPDEINGKSVLLIDDIFDSGATIKEIGKILTNFGASKIVPIVIARTVGGDLV